MPTARRQLPFPFPFSDPPPSTVEWRALMVQWDAACVRAGIEYQRGTLPEGEMWERIAFYSHLWTRASYALAEMAGGA